MDTQNRKAQQITGSENMYIQVKSVYFNRLSQGSSANTKAHYYFYFCKCKNIINYVLHCMICECELNELLLTRLLLINWGGGGGEWV